MNNHHNPIEDFSDAGYLEELYYIDDDGEVRTAYLPVETPWLPVNDPRNFLSFGDNPVDPDV